jgi:hypothetical protein
VLSKYILLDTLNMFLYFLINVIIFCIVMYLNGFVAINLINPIKTLPHLPDIGFDYLVQISPKIPNYLILLYCLYFVIRFVNKSNIKSLSNLCMCLSILFTFRLITFSVTYVPPTLSNCFARDPNAPIEWNILKFLLSNDDNTCVDYMFSGHATFFTIIYLYIIQYSNNFYEKITFTFITPIAILSIICGHIHYTADVVVGMIMSFMAYCLILESM